MNHLIAFAPYSAFPSRGKVFLLRQGLEPIIDTSVTVTWPSPVSNAGNFRCQMKAAPSNTKGVILQMGNPGSLTNYFTVSGTTLSFTNTTSSFSGTINDTFTGNDYYGFVGLTTSFINAFKWSDHSLVTLNKTGLGDVYSSYQWLQSCSHSRNLTISSSI
jgi:hypothetical protein